MKIIISPAKQMNENLEVPYQGLPIYMSKTEEIKSWMQSLSYEEAKKLWACNDKIASQNYERFSCMNLEKRLTPAILSYDGIAYKYMGPSVFQYDEFDYVEENLRILSGFYGVLKPMDGVTPYRLEMQAKAAIHDHKNLYDYWGRKLYDAVIDDSHIIINLASKEYSKCIEKYLQPEDRYITCIFGEYAGKKIVQKGVYAKMARGEMVRYMAENNIQDPDQMKSFDRLGYIFQEELSDNKTFVFMK